MFFKRSSFLLFLNLCLFIFALRFFKVELMFQILSSSKVNAPKAVRRFNKDHCGTKVSKNDEDKSELVFHKKVGAVVVNLSKRKRLVVETSGRLQAIIFLHRKQDGLGCYQTGCQRSKAASQNLTDDEVPFASYHYGAVRMYVRT